VVFDEEGAGFFMAAFGYEPAWGFRGDEVAEGNGDGDDTLKD
jgi:hypothetical protein